LAFAKKVGANEVIKVETRDGKAVASQVEKALGSPADITIECSGAESSIQAGIYVHV
jgi:L-iditol 2-dehydrogenase